MRILFFMRNFSGYFRQFEPALVEMLERGHQVHVARDRDDAMSGSEWAEGLARRYPGQLSWDHTPGPKDDEWYQLKRELRLTRDYVHFMRPRFEETPEFYRRARRRAPVRVVKAFDRSLLHGPETLERVWRAICMLEDATPPNPAIERYIAARDPHIVLQSPHLTPGSLQTEYLRAAQDLGLRTGLCVASWDNLSSKQIVRIVPDVVTVWNETQKREALELHGLPEDRVAVTGAQVYDHWFAWQARPREAFCRRVGLPADRPYLVYLGGALFPAEITEAQFVERWLERLRSDTRSELSDAAVLVRPHPKRAEEWDDVDIERFGHVALWPRDGRMPVDRDAKADFYDSIYHSAAVVGLNTSAMIEAGIVGRRVHTLFPREFSGSQLGTIHFRYLLEVAGGLLKTAASVEEHCDQLAAAIASPGAESNPAEKFIEAFVRPHGLESPSSPIFVDTIERIASHGPVAPTQERLRSRLLRWALAPLAAQRRWSVRLMRKRKNRSRLEKARRVAPEAAADLRAEDVKEVLALIDQAKQAKAVRRAETGEREHADVPGPRA